MNIAASVGTSLHAVSAAETILRIDQDRPVGRIEGRTYGADLNARDPEGEDPLMLAALSNAITDADAARIATRDPFGRRSGSATATASSTNAGSRNQR